VIWRRLKAVFHHATPWNMGDHMRASLDRRTFSRSLALGLGAISQLHLPAQRPSRRLKIGHTGITWGRSGIEQAIQDIARLGYHGFETFGNVLESWEAQGGLGRVLVEHNLPLISGYCGCDLMDSTKRKEEIEKMVGWGKLIKKCGGNVSVIGPNSVKREEYDFNVHKANIVASLNETAKALTDIGLIAVLHQHTGTCVETRDETYAVMEAVDTRYVKFGPDVGQLAKGGSDPVQVVKDFLPLIHHMHLKDFSGGEHFIGYCPLGQGRVDIAAILDLMEGVKPKGMIMVELDAGRNIPMTPLETARISKGHLQNLGYSFRI
jgi:inosose dehydratase